MEELYQRLAKNICGSLVIPYQGQQIDLGHWDRLTMVEAVKKYAGVDFDSWTTDEEAVPAPPSTRWRSPPTPPAARC